MYLLTKKDMNKIEPLFDGWNETMIWSCLQGYMGNAWIDNSDNPKSGQIIMGDFCLFAGVSDAELVKNIPDFYRSEFIIMIPQNEAWSELIEQQYNKAEKITRYAFKKEPNVFDRQKLASFVESLPPEYSIRQIDEAIYNDIKNKEWLEYLCSQFPAYSDFEGSGIGFVAFHGDKPVAGASSYSIYEKGIEIEVDTIEEYRRKGLALACSAKLILECIERGIYPSWDAANKESVALAERLGYQLEKEYAAYSVTDFR